MTESTTANSDISKAIAEFQKGISFQNAGDLNSAIQCYDTATQLNPKYVEAYFNKAVALKFIQEYEKAIECYDTAIQLNPQYQKAYLNKSVILYSIGEYQLAIECLDIAIQLNPKDEEAYSNKSVALYSIGEYEKAIECFDIAIKLNPKYQNAYSNKGMVLISMGENEKAIACIDIAIQLNPKDVLAYSNKGIALENIGEYHQAIEFFDKAIQLNPKFEKAYSNKGVAFYSIGENHKAIECYDIAIKLNPNYENAYLNKGAVLEEIGEYKKSIECLDIALQLNPNNGEAYFNKSLGLRAIGENQKALECVNSAIELEPNNPVYFCMRSKLHTTLNQKELALKDLKVTQRLINEGEFSGQSLKRIEAVKQELQEITHLEELIQKVREDIKKLDPEKQQIIASNFTQIEKQQNDELEKVYTGLNKNKQKTNDEILEMKDKFAKMEEILLQFQKKLDDQNAKIEHHEKVLEKAGVFDEAKIKEEYEKFEEEDSNLSLYFRIFYWTMANYFQAYRVMNTETFASNKNHCKSDLQVGVGFFGKVCSALPIVGGIIGSINNAINSVFEAIKEQKIENISNAINNIIMTKFSDEAEISKQIRLAAVDIINYKKSQIIFPLKKQNTQIERITSFIDDKIILIKSQLIEESVIPIEQDNETCQLAIADVTLLLTYMQRHSGAISKKKEPLSKQMVSIIKYNQIETDFQEQKEPIPLNVDLVPKEVKSQAVLPNVDLAPQEAKSQAVLPNEEGVTQQDTKQAIVKPTQVQLEIQPQKPERNEKSACSGCCTVFKVNRIEYSNALLNHPDTFFTLVNIIGIDNAINLGERLSNKGIIMNSK